MPSMMLISILCPDQIGLVAMVTGRLFDLGGNLRSTNFAVLGGGAEFTSVCDISNDLTAEQIEKELKTLPELHDAEISVTEFDFAPEHAPHGRATHRIEIIGGDRPGLIARLSEVFVHFKANIVRLNAEQIPGSENHYLVRIAAWIPQENAQTCLATVANTAGELGLKCMWQTD
ncbi:MAG: amino acid-binding protein [Rhodospirillales bacterium]|nr:amino acid-binding protein [Rhodospirillales bacterium]